MAQWQGVFFWGFLLVFGLVMLVVSPRAKTEESFFLGYDDKGRPSSQWMLTASIFISWIFAKSVTNAANLGQTYGIVGGLAYATYWLSIPVAGIVIYILRTRYGASGLVAFLTGRYGRAAALAFSAAILVRLYNEIWSNSAVVGGYYGSEGSVAFIASASLFTFLVLLYSPERRTAELHLHGRHPDRAFCPVHRDGAGPDPAHAWAGATCERR